MIMSHNDLNFSGIIISTDVAVNDQRLLTAVTQAIMTPVGSLNTVKNDRLIHDQDAGLTDHLGWKPNIFENTCKIKVAPGILSGIKQRFMHINLLM